MECVKTVVEYSSLLPFQNMSKSDDCPENRCGLCGRTGVRTTAHHLIPRAVHRKRRFRERYGLEEMRRRKVDLCRLCHRAVHELIPSERELAENYSTITALLRHADIARHVAWAGKQKSR
ncbi:hypothetical protein [Stratiformator vulcanicus]|uniref:HNH domain-containing protein n=1 Tax=Stratiformator vulcanicus TaxID=2527980 RepID=A0A517QZL7_9PLAN|nr:hypothetical protein [Stratiformator vulcanicus]QDT37079.1 hypothetical protein Pan189_14460 [Stratiformator vulcanicus]